MEFGEFYPYAILGVAICWVIFFAWYFITHKPIVLERFDIFLWLFLFIFSSLVAPATLVICLLVILIYIMVRIEKLLSHVNWERLEDWMGEKVTIRK